MVDSITLQKEFTGSLKGMSGGALLYTDTHHSYDTENPSIELVGILNEFDSKTIYSCHIGRLIGILILRAHIPLEF